MICDVDKMINRTMTPLDAGGAKPVAGNRRIPYASRYRILCHNAVGADRLIFGTKLPWQAVGPPHAELMYADIDDDARRAIGATNLDRLLAMAAW